MRASSRACIKRFSKIVSVITEEPSACVMSVMYWACISVGKPGYSCVVTSRARSLLPALTVKRAAAVRALTRFANHSHAHLVQFGKDGGEVLRVAAFQLEFPAGNRRRDQECPGFNAVRNNACARRRAAG